MNAIPVNFQNQLPQNLGRLPLKSKENRKWSRFWKRDCKKMVTVS